jgi:hypothetical protein
MNTLISPISSLSQPRVAILTSESNQNEEALRQAVQSAVQNQFPHAIFLSDRKEPGKTGLADRVLNDHGISFYQKMAEKGASLFLSIISAIGLQMLALNASSVKKKLRHFIEEEKPDLIISTAPLINGPLLEAASTDQIPVLILPSDHDSSLYSNHWPAVSSRLSPYCYAPAYSCIEVTNRIHRQVDRMRIQAVGCWETSSEKTFSFKEKMDIREKLHLQEDKKIVLCMLDEPQNPKHSLSCLNHILKNRHTLKPAHYAIFCNHQDSMKSSKELLIETGFFQNENGHFVHPELEMTFSLAEGSSIQEYMTIAYCVWAKAKSPIFNQAIFKNIPILFDDTTKQSSSEQLNNSLIRQYGLGERISTYNEIPVKLQKMLDPDAHDAQLRALGAFQAARPEQFQFAKNIQLITQNLLTEAFAAKKPSLVTVAPSRWKKCLSTAKKILVFVAKLALFPILVLKTICLEWFPHHLVQFGFFSAFIRTHIKQESILKYFFLSKDQLKARRQEMIERGAVPIENVISNNNTFLDAMHIPAQKPNPEKKTVIFILARHYQNCHPKQYEYMLQEGWDVVLFNPSKTNSISMKNDFIALIEKLRANNPQGIKLAVHGYCIGAHAAAAGGAEIAEKQPENPPIAMILDRGFGDSNEAVENYMSIAKLPLFRNKIRAEYNLKAAEKVTKFAGKVLFTSPPSGKDQLMHCNNRNLTKELYDRFPLGNKTWHVLPDTWDEAAKTNKPATHWSPWTKATQDVAIKFLHEYFDEDTKAKPEELHCS